MDGYGNVSWWGFSPSLDLSVYFPDEDSGDASVNVLLVNNHDPRHIIHTLCNLAVTPQDENQPARPSVNFYVVEPFVEQVGRYMLLLHIMMDSSLGVQEKVELFLETFGNSLVRSATAEDIAQRASSFIDLVTDLDLCKQQMPLCDLSLLKHKERDYLEGTLKFWRAKDYANYEIHQIWDLRCRNVLGPRYDTKENAFDWDRIMKLNDRGANIIHKVEYETFRSKGVAFESRAGDYDVPNRTLFSPVVFTDQKSDKVIKRGYFGDVITGPFISFGVESKNEDLFKKANNMYTQSSLDVATYNLQELFKKIPFNSEATSSGDNQTNITQNFSFTNISVKFVFGRDLQYFIQKPKFQHFFSLICLASDAAHLLKPDISALLNKSEKSTVLVEVPKYVLDLKKEQVVGIVDTLVENAKSASLAPLRDVDKEKPFQHNILAFSNVVQ